jgi:hypothetical protein
MVLIGRIIGWLLLIAAGITLAGDVFAWYQTGTWHLISGNELWYRIDRNSLTTARTAVQRYASPVLWDSVIQTILQFYALVVLAVPGLLLLWVTRSRAKRERRAKSSQMRAE